MRAAMADLETRRAAAEKVVATYKDLLSRFKTLIDAGTLQVKIVDGRMVVVLKTDILFSSGSAELSKEGKDALAQVAQVLAGFDRNFQIEGHTDNVPIHSDKYASNWYLASARAIGVVDHLIASGMDPKRLSAASYGEFVPVAANDTADGKAQNRRIDIVIQPDLSQLPGFEELQSVR
jgi:chemotaxis protein MotB